MFDKRTKPPVSSRSSSSSMSKSSTGRSGGSGGGGGGGGCETLFPCQSLLAPSMKHFQGPAIYQFDDANFSFNDFQSIQDVGNGLKRGDPTKTGQFGIGFNSCYHVTDVPMFISGSYLVVFDPHKRYLPPISSPDGRQDQSTGVFYDLSKQAAEFDGRHFCDKYKDQINPFVGLFGCTDKGYQATKGTLFRFPLRNDEVSRNSLIKKYNGADNLDEVAKEIIVPFIDTNINRLITTIFNS